MRIHDRSGDVTWFGVKKWRLIWHLLWNDVHEAMWDATGDEGVGCFEHKPQTPTQDT